MNKTVRGLPFSHISFEPRINSDEVESLSGEEPMESDEEGPNPRLENSDWYVSLLLSIGSLH